MEKSNDVMGHYLSNYQARSVQRKTLAINSQVIPDELRACATTTLGKLRGHWAISRITLF
jgi:hypothetical protein